MPQNTNLTRNEAESSDKTPAPLPQGVPFAIPPEQVEQRWPVISQVLAQAQNWTLLIDADDIRSQLMRGTMRPWGVLDHLNQLVLAFTRFTPTANGLICVAWLMVPTRGDDDAALRALLDELEAFARWNAAAALEINTAPWMAPRIEAMSSAKQTSVAFEMDLRAHRRVN